ncbi:DUF1643 domain-containing protein [Leptolyngbya ohadii]|uniref:DUF1643 domain-containing protein n=1 Tax=Leptolyngbya ohadii TaxID=1962290 RepID=UPI001CEDADDC|nr:DUF1643 domain-containing protein [Leptolyngbya ohadii]
MKNSRGSSQAVLESTALEKTILPSGAVFDVTGDYRYLLWRTWNADAPRLTFVMLNPSTADADCNDPTIRRCIQFAQTWGYGSLKVVNLFGFKATHPKILQQASDPIGTENDRHLLTAVQSSDRIVIAWGNWGTLANRDRMVMDLIRDYGVYCLGVNRSGQPKHPLYLSGKTVPILFCQ